MSEEYPEQGQYPQAYQGPGYEHYTNPYPDARQEPGAQGPGEPGADGFAPGGGVWMPLGQNGEFDAEATMSTQFVQHLDFNAPRDGADPLAAPGHGYVPQGYPGRPDGYGEQPGGGFPQQGTGFPQYGEGFAPQDFGGGFEQPHTPPAGTDWHPAAEPPAQPEEQAAAEQWSVPFAPEDPAEESGEYSVGISLPPSGGHPHEQSYAPGGYPAPAPDAAPYPYAPGEQTGTYAVPGDTGPYGPGEDTGTYPAPGTGAYEDTGTYPAGDGGAYGSGEDTGTYPAPGDGGAYGTGEDTGTYPAPGEGGAAYDHAPDAHPLYTHPDPGYPHPDPAAHPGDAPGTYPAPGPEGYAPGDGDPAAPQEAPHPAGPAPGTFGSPDDTLGVGADLAAAAAFAPVHAPATPEAPPAPDDAAPPGDAPPAPDGPPPRDEDPAGEPAPDAPGEPDGATVPAPAGAAHDVLPIGADEAVPEYPEHPDAHSEHPTASFVLTVNGTERPVTDAWLGESLLYVLRERLGLAGVKDGCEQGECGACSVQVDGRLVASCLVPAATAAGSEVRTVEGLAADGTPSDVQRALAECGAVQCGFCIPGMAMTVHDLLEGNHSPTGLQTRAALAGNLCRCSGYQGVLAAVRRVSTERAAAHEAEREAELQAAHEAGIDPAYASNGDVFSDGAARIPHQATGDIPHQATGEPDGAPS